MKFKLEEWLYFYNKALTDLKVSTKTLSDLTGKDVAVKIDSP